MKVLLISYYFPPSNAVGSKRVYSFYKTLIKNNFEVKVLKKNFKFTFNNRSERKKIKSKFFNKIKSILTLDDKFRSIDKTLFSSFFFKSILSFFSIKKVDIVFVSYKPSSVIYLGILAKFFFNAKLIIDTRDLISNMGTKKKYFLLYQLDKWLDKFIMSFADEIITVSEVAALKSSVFYNKKINCIMNGIDGYIRPFNNINLNKIRILYSGSLSNTRNLENINKFLISINVNYELVIASESDPKIYGGNYKNNIWVGYLSEDKLVDLIKTCNFFLLLEGYGAGSFENIPAKVFEYLKYNYPILIDCNPSSQVSEIITKNNKGYNINKKFDIDALRKLDFSNYNKSTSLIELSRGFQNKKLLEIIKNI